MARILVVDGDVLVRKTLMQVFMLHGHLAIGTGSGKQALVMHHELAPDLVLVDMNLTDMNGLDVIRALGKTACPPRIVAMSGWGLPLFDMAILLGADKLLEKPFVIQELLDIVPLKAA